VLLPKTACASHAVPAQTTHVRFMPGPLYIKAQSSARRETPPTPILSVEINKVTWCCEKRGSQGLGWAENTGRVRRMFEQHRAWSQNTAKTHAWNDISAYARRFWPSIAGLAVHGWCECNVMCEERLQGAVGVLKLSKMVPGAPVNC